MTDPLLTEFLQTKHGKTRKVYQLALRHYMTFTGKSMTELIEEAEDEEDQGLRRRSRGIKKYISGYKTYREDMNHSPYTVRDAVSKVRSFYNYYDIDLPHQRMRYDRVDRVGAEDLPSRDEIRRAVNLANPKYKAIILLGCSSGMGASEITSLTTQHLLDGIGVKSPLSIDEARHFIETERAPLIKWQIRRVKTGTPYVTFSNPETLHSILEYLDYENPDMDDGYLFPGANGEKLQVKSLAAYYHKLNSRCGWKGRGGGRQNFFRSHVIRKWFAVHIERQIGYSATRRLLGHRVAVDPVGDTYILTDPEHLMFLYRQGMGAVSVFDKVKVHHVSDERVEELERKVRELEELKRMWELYDQLP